MVAISVNLDEFKVTKKFGWPTLKIDVLNTCMNCAEICDGFDLQLFKDSDNVVLAGSSMLNNFVIFMAIEEQRAIFEKLNVILSKLNVSSLSKDSLAMSGILKSIDVPMYTSFKYLGNPRISSLASWVK